MMTIASKINMSNTGGLLTRSQAKQFRQLILQQVHKNQAVEIDLGHLPMSPSFTDECFGLLIEDIGREKFKKYIHLINLSPASKSIMLHVLKQRSIKAA
jgi:hypothetical protein